MRIIIKKLQGDECLLEVEPTTTVLDIKKQIRKKLGVPVNEQKLLLLGRTLADNLSVASCSTIKDGSKIYLVIKKPEGLFELAVKRFQRFGMSHSDATVMARKFLQMIKVQFYRMSWDDVDKLSLDCLMDARRQRRLRANRAINSEPMDTM